MPVTDAVDPRLATALVDHVERVVLGKHAVVELAVTTLLAGGHLLIEDVPGLAKTLLARALARAIGADERRIQGAPDLLPTDLTGASVWRPDDHRFQFIPGPLFANVVLVDEANRMPPRTQAALLEAMEEGQVSADGVTHVLPQPHLVIATQNPIEQQGTYPLPEAQLDRFTAATNVGYPDPVHEAAIIAGQLHTAPLSSLGPLLDLHQLAALQAAARSVVVTAPLVDYVVRLVAVTRTLPGVRLGASPRAGLQLARMAQAAALLQGRGHALPDDVKRLAGPVLTHRVLTHPGAPTPAEVIAHAVAHTPVDR
ncbi:MAG TPA: AAA family ATPase [Euzebya sp.]|nr:AAA family ATPase [Euzebya sp.]